MVRHPALDQLASAAPVIAPSMLKCDYGNLHREVELLQNAGAEVLHWDVMDGHFVPNLSYGALVIEPLRQATDMFFDAHLMISEPGRYLDSYLNAGCDAITFHIEAEPDAGPLLERIRAAGVLAGLALNPQTPVDHIAEFIPACDLVLVMSVEPGFGGQAFQDTALDKIARIAELTRPESVISVDGGIDPRTISDCARAGASMFVAGSAIFNQPDYAAAIRGLKELAQGVGTSN